MKKICSLIKENFFLAVSVPRSLLNNAQALFLSTICQKKDSIFLKKGENAEKFVTFCFCLI